MQLYVLAFDHRTTIPDFFSPKNLDMRTATHLKKKLEGE